MPHWNLEQLLTKVCVMGCCKPYLDTSLLPA